VLKKGRHSEGVAALLSDISVGQTDLRLILAGDGIADQRSCCEPQSRKEGSPSQRDERE